MSHPEPHLANTLGQQHHHAVAVLLDYDDRAQTAASGQQVQDMQTTWFGLQVHIGRTPLLLPQQQLAEILAPPVLTPIPGVPTWVLGLANHYGKLLPVIDLHSFIYGRRWPDISHSRVIVTDTDPNIGFIVSRLGHSVRTAPPQARTASLTIDTPLQRWVSGQTQQLGEDIAVLELSPLINAVTHWKRH